MKISNNKFAAIQFVIVSVLFSVCVCLSLVSAIIKSNTMHAQKTHGVSNRYRNKQKPHIFAHTQAHTHTYVRIQNETESSQIYFKL